MNKTEVVFKIKPNISSVTVTCTHLDPDYVGQGILIKNVMSSVKSRNIVSLDGNSLYLKGNSRREVSSSDFYRTKTINSFTHLLRKFNSE